MKLQRFAVSRWFFKLVRHLYPRHLREAYENELEDFFIGTLVVETERMGILGVPYVWWNTATDVLFRRGRLTRSYFEERSRSSLFQDFGSDVTFGLRGLRRQPLYSITVIGTLVVGIGATVAMFSLLYNVLIRPLPYADPSQLVLAWSTNSQLGLTKQGPSPGDVLDWGEANNTLQSLAAWFVTSGTYQEENYAEQLVSAQATGDFFRVLGVDAAFGRTFVVEDVVSALGPAVISHAFWQRRFGGDSSIVGRTIHISGAPIQIVGVMPRDFAFPSRNIDLWTAWNFRLGYARLDAAPRTWRFLNTIARLKPGVTAVTAQADLTQIATNLGTAYPESNHGWGVRLTSLFDDTVQDARAGLLLGFAAVGFLLLLTCVNVANMLLARLPARANELAVRAAIGASKGRLVRQLLTETGLMVFAATMGGVVVALGLIRFVVQLNANTLPRIETTSLDGATLAFALALTLAVTLFCGVAPAAHVTRAVNPAHGDSNRVGSTKRHRRLQHGLVIAQLAIAVVLLVGTGLLGESFRRLRTSDLGYDDTNVLTYRLSLNIRPNEVGYVGSYYRAVIDSMRTLPGVTNVGASTALPLDPVGNDFTRPFRSPREQTSSAEAQNAQMRIVTPGYFAAIGLRFQTGTTFTGTERIGESRAAIVNERLARQQWPDEPVVGKQLMLDFRGGWQPYTVIGVVSDVKHYGARVNVEPEIFVPASQVPYLAMSIAVRTNGEPERLIPSVQSKLRTIDASQPPHHFKTLRGLRADSIAEDRFLFMVFTLFGAVAIVLATTGVYGVLAYAVSKRKHEIGVRLALGASPNNLANTIVRQAMTLAASGLVIGIIAAWQLSRLISELLYAISTVNAGVFAGVGLLLFGVASIAAILPARRSTRIPPTDALRAD